MDASTECQVFFFSQIDKPPYMTTSTLPQRLAKIRHIHVHYTEYTGHVPPTVFNPNRTVDRRCSTCNFCHWLETITKYMTGLRTFEISLRFHNGSYPSLSLSHAWVVRLLELQQRSKAMIKVVIDHGQHRNSVPPGSPRQTDAFMLELQKELTRLRESKDAVIEIPDA